MRESGILLAVSSLPSRYGIGCFDDTAYRFADWLAHAGQKLWQILPLGPTGYGDSPYQSFSAFAGNPYFIALEELIDFGLLTEEECNAANFGSDPSRVDYGAMYTARFALLRLAYARSNFAGSIRHEEFVKEHADWLPDYALFMALKGEHGGAAWSDWEEPLRCRDPQALADARERLADDIAFYEFLQFWFYRQWDSLHAYAGEKGIRILGDIPIYAAFDSADVWASPELFQLDDDLRPTAVAGCPPDAFAADGQLWGNPLYRWDYHAQTGYDWWIRRIRFCFRNYDILRIDHFRGFDEYFSIPGGDPTAKNGHWEPGPGLALFQAAEAALGKQEIIAEDLGYVSDSVRQLVRDTGFPGMKVLQFAFDSRDTGFAPDYLPHNYPTNSAAYTGTHDNATLRGWLGEITPEERKKARDYLACASDSDMDIARAMLCGVLRSPAKYAVIPMQDWLFSDADARMNKPSTQGSNWCWRVQAAELNEGTAEFIRRTTERYGR